MSDHVEEQQEAGVDTVSAEARHSQADGRIFPCRQCGADVVFHIGTQNLKCPYCGYEQELSVDKEQQLVERDYLEMLEQLQSNHEDLSETSGIKEVDCDACGGTVVFEGTLTSTHCPYCASPIQLDKIHETDERIKPDGVLTFKIEEDQAHRLVSNWVSSLWFAPSDFLKAGVSGKLNGVYLPFWTFDSMTFVQYAGERGEEYRVTVGVGKNRRRVTRVRWYDAAGTFQRFFDDVVVLACQKMSPQLTRGLEPWPLQGIIPFTRESLAGYLCRTYDVELPIGFKEAKQRIEQTIEQDVRRRIGGDRQRVHQIHSQFSAITFKYVLLPTWLLSYRYKDRVYQVMINATTGKVMGERPWSAWKIAFAVLGGLIVFLLFMLIFAGR
ncbi:MAG: hypothetical protein KDA78_06405 [Planctomycetaceae bacterium]|nr:hypothetical protein [Planctomycetaceae bacterium]